MQRSLESELPGLRQDPYTATLQRHIASLEAEVERLRQVAREKETLEETAARLREANEHLVLAAISDQGLREEAEAANRRQNEFLAMLAHELRNPLVPISMSSMLLERSADASPQVLNFSRVIRRQVDHMSRLLDDLLDAARISSGKITLNLEPLSLAEIIDHAVETVIPRIRERRQELHLHLPPPSVGTRGDRVRLTQVFTNLLSNASKYTGDAGNIELAVEVQDGQTVATISDNGTGIAPEVLPHIFDLFTQGPRSLARSEGGLGVGLNVVRNLVSMHGGTVEAHSEGIGRGSVFRVRLPLDDMPAAEPPPQDTGAVATKQCQVLLIEDNIDACETLKAFLDMEGHETSMAHDGARGLDMLLAGQFDVVVCDIGLPGMDGLEVVSRLRAAPGGTRPVAIGLSGYGQAEDRARALGAGFDHYLVKPVDPDALLALVAERC
ncbi:MULTISPECIES: ATP-binding protein [unclassified Massilia]|uniref:hybrid sensor histidine kinase/response regulator n=1 Tax=unclassified Massilia TaxID=2609279 RepID=UPI001E5C8460|nr:MULTISPECIES: ATP-binding protein [unclassified Massilia]